MYKVEETILEYVRKNVPVDDELKKQIIKDGNYRAIKEKYPSIFKGMIKLQEKLIEEAECNIGRQETGYRPLLDKAIEKEDFEKFYDEVILEIVPDKTPWSQTYLVIDNGFGPLVVERVNPLPEFGLIGEEKYGYIMFGCLCLGRRFNKIEDDGTFSNAEIGLDCDMVSYFRLIYDVYKGVSLSLEEAIKILQDRGFLTGYSVEELVKYDDKFDRLLGYSKRVRNRVKLVYRLDVEDRVPMDDGDRVALIPYNDRYEAGNFSKIYFYHVRDARIFAEKYGLKIVNKDFNLNTEKALYLLEYRVREYKKLHQGALPMRIRVSKAAAEALKDYMAEDENVLGYSVVVDESLCTNLIAVVCEGGVVLWAENKE